MHINRDYFKEIELYPNIDEEEFGTFGEVSKKIFIKDISLINVIKLFFKTFSDERDDILEEIRVRDRDSTFTALLFIPQNFLRSYYNWYINREDNRLSFEDFAKELFKNIGMRFEAKGMDYYIQQEDRRGLYYSNIGDSRNISRVINLSSLENRVRERRRVTSTFYLFIFKNIKLLKYKDSLEYLDINLKNSVRIYDGEEVLIDRDNRFIKLKSNGDIILHLKYRGNSLILRGDNIDKIDSQIEYINSILKDMLIRINYDIEVDRVKEIIEEYGEIDLTIHSLDSILDRLIIKRDSNRDNRDNRDNRERAYIPTEDISSRVKEQFTLSLERFNIPLEDLKELHLYLIEKDGKRLIAGGSNINTNKCKLILKIIYYPLENDFHIQSLSGDRFLYARGKALIYRESYNESKSNPNYQILREKENNIFSGFSSISFIDSLIEVYDNRVSIRYINHKVKNFFNKVKLNRHLYKICKRGNLIDIIENLKYGARVKINDEKRIIGSLISSRSFILIEDLGSRFKITNKTDKFILIVGRGDKLKHIMSRESLIIPKEVLLEAKYLKLTTLTNKLEERFFDIALFSIKEG